MTRPGPFVGLRRREQIGLGVLAAVLVVVESVFISVGRHEADPGLFVLWCCVQAAICIAGGLFQGLRGRSWWEVIIVGAMAAMVLGFLALTLSDSDPGSADCPGQAPCDLSFGFGAIVIVLVTAPLFTGVACLGRALGGVIGGEGPR